MAKPENRHRKKESHPIVQTIILDQNTTQLPLAQVLVSPPKFPQLIVTTKQEPDSQQSESSESSEAPKGQ